jgi:glycosyltransferase involved in cell wall biosynthesis
VKIFLSVNSLQPAYGGPARSVSQTAAALAAAGAEVGLWAADQSARTTRFLPDPSAVIRLIGSPEEALAAFARPDIVHDNGIWLSHHHRLALVAATRRVPRVVSTRGMLQPWAMRHKALKKRAAWWLYQRRDLARASCLHATTPAEAAHLESLKLGVPIRVIYNGIDIPGVPDAAPTGPVKTALFLGRIYPVKGLPMLVEAWSRVRPAGWRLRIAGPDEAGHQAHVQRLITTAGLNDSVSFAGAVESDTKRAALIDADLVVLPSHSESFGMVVGEALAHGVPVLTTTAVPWPVLESHRCGWRVPPSVEGLSEGLRVATALPRGALRAMGETGRKYVTSEFQWNQIAQLFLAMYREVL